MSPEAMLQGALASALPLSEGCDSPDQNVNNSPDLEAEGSSSIRDAVPHAPAPTLSCAHHASSAQCASQQHPLQRSLPTTQAHSEPVTANLSSQEVEVARSGEAGACMHGDCDDVTHRV